MAGFNKENVMDSSKRNKVRKIIKKRAQPPKESDTLHLPMTFDEALTNIFKNPKPPKKNDGQC
jgi:hypothetical protein